MVGEVKALRKSPEDMLLADIVVYPNGLDDLFEPSVWRKVLQQVVSWFRHDPTDYRRRGLGSLLLQSVIEYARVSGVKWLHGSLTKQDLNGTPGLDTWYMRHGFSIGPRTSQEIEDAAHRVCLDL